MKKPTARSVAYELLDRVSQQDAYANLLLPKLLSVSKLEARERGFCQELAFGTLRNQMFYDAVISSCAGRSIDQIDVQPLNLLRLGCHQLLSMRVPTHAAINETVELAKSQLRPGLSGFINGVLRRVSEKSLESWIDTVSENSTDNNEKLSVRYSHPIWIVRALADSLRADGRASDIEVLLREDNAAPQVNLVALPGLSTRDQLQTEAVALNCHTGNNEEASPLGLVIESGDPWGLPSVAAGKARVQDQGSQLAALVLSAAPILTHSETEEWLDLCAGPGGKAALLAAIARQQHAELVCNELQPHRAKLVKQALSAIDTAVYVRTGDGRELGDDAPESFDRILLDAPCTGLGALRRRPEARYRRSNADVATLVQLQLELFESAYRGLKPGGVLAYVTCSPHLAETTGLVEQVTRKYADIELLDAMPVLASVNPNLVRGVNAVNTTRKTIQLWPHIQQTDAMFIALFRKPVRRK